jgi:hypothetical protein
MKTPGFNAEKSLYRTGGRYRTGGKAWSGSRMDSHILPQQSKKCTGICNECNRLGNLCAAGDYDSCWAAHETCSFCYLCELGWLRA